MSALRITIEFGVFLGFTNKDVKMIQSLSFDILELHNFQSHALALSAEIH